MDLVAVDLEGAPLRGHAAADSDPALAGVVGVDVAATTVDGDARTVVQVLFDDDVAGFDRSLLDSPMVAELTKSDGTVLAREPLDHDRFRRRLHAEREAGESVTRGVLVLTHGELPPPWVRLAFLPVAVTATAGARLTVRRTSVESLRDGVEQAYAAGELGDDERGALLTSLEQLHPTEDG